jgi:hypothetical protein
MHCTVPKIKLQHCMEPVQYSTVFAVFTACIRPSICVVSGIVRSSSILVKAVICDLLKLWCFIYYTVSSVEVSPFQKFSKQMWEFFGLLTIENVHCSIQ